MFKLPRAVQYSALVLLLGTSALVAPAYANDAAKSPKHHRMHHEWNMREHVEKRIQALHDAIQVTPEQESDWSDVADAMRDNESKIGDLMREHRQNREDADAIEMLRSYQGITQTHADSMTKFINAFEPFYDDLSSEQKLKADEFFKKRHHLGKDHVPHKKGGTKPAAPAVKAK